MPSFRTDNLRIEQQPNGTALLWLEVAGRSVNVLGRQVLADLDNAFDRVAEDADTKTLVIRSGKSAGFCFGADLNELATIQSSEEASALSELGQKLFAKLENLRVPTVALIHGPCLGGGLELALACDYRLALDHPKTQFGLPEINLGLLPGWGGTQRLPRVIGLERAFQVILLGRRLNARQALGWRLLDGAAPTASQLATQLELLLVRIERRGKRPKRGLPLHTWRQRLVESNPLGRWVLFKGAERVLAGRVPDDMPAPREALEALQIGMKQGMAAGLAYERQAVGRLATTPACRNLVTLFFQGEKVKQLPAELAKEAGPPIRKVGVVGAGTMGAGIAQLAVVKGCEVTVREVNDQALAAGMKRIDDLFRQAVERRILTAEEARTKREAIKQTTQWDFFDVADLVIEAVIEDLDLKRSVFRELEWRAKPNAILATNTSSLLVGRLQEGLAHPERVAGLHFFNPVHKMPLIEVVRAPATAEPVIAALVQWALGLGKTPVCVKDSPGFVVNRILMPYLNEAVLLAVEGVPGARIDKAMTRFGMPMGPLELLDQVGLDVAAHIAKAMQPAFGDRFAPNPAFERLAEKGWLGQKSGTGFYRYQGKKKTIRVEAMNLVRGLKAPGADETLSPLPPAVQTHQARDRMVLLTINEAAMCLGEGLAAGAEVIDLAMVLGTGWAPHRGGPLRYADELGAGEVVKRLGDLARRLGPRFEPCADLRRRAETGERFYTGVGGQQSVGGNKGPLITDH